MKMQVDFGRCQDATRLKSVRTVSDHLRFFILVPWITTVADLDVSAPITSQISNVQNAIREDLNEN